MQQLDKLFPVFGKLIKDRIITMPEVTDAAQMYTRYTRNPVVAPAPATQPAAPQTTENTNENADATPASVE